MLVGILFRDRFQQSTKSLQERFSYKLHTNAPIVIKDDEGAYIILLNRWNNAQHEPSAIQLQHSKQPTEGFQQLDFEVKQLEALPEETVIVPRLAASVADRQYFKLTYSSGSGSASIIVGERLLNMTGTVNFRDIGGYVTKDGKMVAWGKIYRSGYLYKLSRKVHPFFNSLQIKTIIDLRSVPVVERFPDKLPKKAKIDTHTIPMESRGLEVRKLRGKILRDDLGDFDALEVLHNAYRGFIQEFIPEIQKVFQLILASEEGVLLHCTAGKDRTGFFSALLLKILGVDDETIMNDYLASNYFRAKETEKFKKITELFTKVENLLPLLEIYPSYWRTALQEMENKYGSFEGFVKDGIKLSDKDIEVLKDRYLVEVPTPTSNNG